MQSNRLLRVMARRMSIISSVINKTMTTASWDSSIRCLTGTNTSKHERIVTFYPRTIITDLFQDNKLQDQLHRLTSCRSVLQYFKHNRHYYDIPAIVTSFLKLRQNIDNSYSLYHQDNFQLLSKMAHQKLTLFNNDEFISICTSLAAFINNDRYITGHALIQLINHIHKNAAQRYPSLNNSQLSHMAWCLIQYSAIPQLDNKQYLQQLAEATQDRIATLNDPVHIAKLMWALSKDRLCLNVFQQLQLQAIENIHKFNSVSISMVCYSLALFDIRSEQLLTAIENRMLAIIDTLDPQSIANIAWAFAKLNWFNDHIFMLIKKRTLDSITKRALRPQSITNIIWAFASLSFDDQQLFTAACRHFLLNHHHYNVDDVCQLIYSLGKMNFKPDSAAKEKIFPIVIGKLENLTHQQHPRTSKFYKLLISAIWSLIIMEQFPSRLISYVLSDSFIKG